MIFAIPAVVKTLGPTILNFFKTKLLGIADSAKSSPMAYVVPICIVAIIGIILIPNMDNIKEKLGFDTMRSLSVKLNQEEHNTDTAVAANKNMEQVHETINNLGISEDIITKDFLKEIKIANETVEIIKDKTNTKIAKINKKPKQSNEERITEISKVNIASIWESYCSFNKDSECKQAA